MNTSPQAPYLTLANRITIVRILGTPVFILLMVYYTLGLRAGEAVPAYRSAALFLFLIVVVTDGLDGYFARRRHEESNLGKILDPIADKLLMISAIVLLTRPSLPELHPQFPIWFAMLVISRDVVLVAGSYVIHLHNGTVQVVPRWSGKLATVLQMLCVGWALAALPSTWFSSLVVAAGVFTLISGIQYVMDGTRQIETTGQQRRQGHPHD
jgi:CDP-diacylglycerol--glycerol-3-phosphate 3-phosphatidyltransferase/cardiolipin synthase